MSSVALEQKSPMKVALTLKNALIVAAIYAVVFITMGKLSGVSYDAVADTADNFLRFAVIPLAVGAVYLTAVSLWAGWWKSLWKDKYKLSGHNWIMIIPVLLVITPVISLLFSNLSQKGAGFIGILVLGAILVGYCEELLFRGMVLQGARNSGYSEIKVMLITMAAFGLFHAPNIINGQALVPTLRQVVFAALFGGVYYVVFRKTGLLVTTMVLHGLWDFSSFVMGAAGATTPNPLVAILNLLTQIVILVVFLASIRFVQVKPAQSATV